VRVGAPGTVTVTVPTLATELVLAVAVILNEPLPVRLAGVVFEIVNHATFLVAVHVPLEFTLIVASLAAAVGVHMACDIVRVGVAAWVTEIVRVGAPGAVTVISPNLGDVPMFVVAFILNEPLPVRVVGTKFETVNHATLLLTAHVLLDVTRTVELPPACVKFELAVDRLSVAGATGCVTEIVLVGAPGAVTVIVPVLCVAPMLAVALILNEPLPVWLAGEKFETVSHEVWLLVTVHVLLDVTRTVELPPACVKFEIAVDRLSVAGATGCVTEIVLVGAPGAVTVIVPVLCVAPVLAVALILNEPLPVRVVGEKFETVSHEVWLLVAVHVLLDVTRTVELPPACVKFEIAVDRLSVAGATGCVTEIVLVGAPGAVTVIVPVLCVVPVLAVALILNEPLPVRVVGEKFETVSHEVWLLVAVHVLLDVTRMVELPPACVKFELAVDRLSVAGATGCVTEIVLVGAPGAVTVIVPVLCVAPVLAVALILNEPLPVRLGGFTLDMVSHDVELLVAVHVLLEPTLISAKLADAGALHETLDRLSVAGATA